MKNKVLKKITKILLLLFLYPIGIFANPVLSVKDIVNLALENAEEIKSSKYELNASKEKKKAYFTNFLPKVSFEGAYLNREESTSLTITEKYLPTYNFDAASQSVVPNIITDGNGNPVIGEDGNPIFQSYAYLPETALEVLPKSAYTYALQIKQPLFMGGKILTAYQMSKIGEKIHEKQVQNTKNSVIYETEKLYWKYVALIEKKKTAKAYLTLLDSLEKTVSNAEKLGLKKKNDVLKVQVKQSDANLKLLRVEQGIHLTKMAICRVIGKPLDFDFSPSDSLSISASPNEFVNLNGKVENRIDYQIIQDAVDIKSKEVRLARAEFLPKVGLSASWMAYNFDLNEQEFDNDGTTIMATIEAPIFRWFESKFKVKEAKLHHKKSKNEMQKYEALMTVEMKQQNFRLKTALAAYKTSKLMLKQATESRRISETQYHLGLESITDLLATNATWQTAYTAFIEAKIEVKLAILKMKKSYGIPLM